MNPGVPCQGFSSTVDETLGIFCVLRNTRCLRYASHSGVIPKSSLGSVLRLSDIL
jgi:hypothetical protein